MKAVVCPQFGDPAEVLEIREVPMPEPAPGQVRVRMIASPINPSDLLYIRGQYGKLPSLPMTPGFEGAGIVEKSGGGLLARRVMGRRVAVLSSPMGNWQEHVIVPAKQAIPVSSSISDEQAAMFFVNPASALVMTQYVLQVPPGAWLLQSAAASALGRMVIRLGKHYGFKTVNVVRRREQVEELLTAGGDAVICSSEEPIADRVREITKGEGVRFAIDAVGGETGSALIRSLGNRGRMLVYGTLSEEPMEVHPRMLMVGNHRVEGFWLSIWARDQGILTMLGLFRRIGKLIKAGVLASEIGATFPMEQVRTAVKEASVPGRKGKVLLRLSGNS